MAMVYEHLSVEELEEIDSGIPGRHGVAAFPADLALRSHSISHYRT